MSKQIEQWLIENAPGDMLMPAVGKAPAHRHRGGVWSWKKWRSYAYSNYHNKDVCVLLQDLCVIDVDSEEQAIALEREFGSALARCPVEKTRRGRHYWFRRSRLCDQAGYFDSRSPVVKGIDFKTRCHNGTSGIIVVAPSSGKSWLRAPWEKGAARLMPIPEALLVHVAAPYHTIVQLPMTFLGDTRATISVYDYVIKAMTYFDPFIGERPGGAFDGCCVPCTRDEFIAAVKLLNEDRNYFRDLESMRAAIRVADKLGVSRSHFFEGKRSGRLVTQAHVLDTPWALDCTSTRILDMTTIPAVKYEPISDPTDMYQMWRDSHVPGVRKGDVVARGKDVLDMCSRKVPTIVMELMNRFPLALAGGNALYAATSSGVCRGADWDMFMYGVEDDAEADRILQEVQNLLDETVSLLPGRDTNHLGYPCLSMPPRVSRNAVTFIVEQEGFYASHDRDVVIQIVLKKYNRPNDIIRSFDLAPVQVVMWVDGSSSSSSSGLNVRATKGCIESLRRMSIVMYGKTVWNTLTSYRVLKYAAKGFAIYIPGVLREAVDTLTKSDQVVGQNILQTPAGMLLNMEDVMQHVAPTDHVAYCTASRYLQLTNARAYAYDSELKSSSPSPSSLNYIFSTLSAGWRAFWGEKRKKEDIPKVVWKPSDAEDTMAMLVDPNVVEAHQQRLLFRSWASSLFDIEDYAVAAASSASASTSEALRATPSPTGGSGSVSVSSSDPGGSVSSVDERGGGGGGGSSVVASEGSCCSTCSGCSGSSTFT